MTLRAGRPARLDVIWVATQYFPEACVGAFSDCELPRMANDWTMTFATWADLAQALAWWQLAVAW
jgi:hypothetical protein